MNRTLPYLLTLLPFAASAQGWVVNQPVDLHLSTITVYGGGCFPALQALLTFGQPPVDGVTYYYKVTSITTDGEYTMVPGPGQALAVDDLVPVQQTDHQVFNSGTYGGLELQVWAMGTPTTAGQAHPCAFSDLWMSNLLLCNEGLTCTLGSNCSTELGNGLTEARSAQGFTFPNAANGYLLRWDGGPVSAGQVLDLGGRMVQALGGNTPVVSLAHLPTGVYVAQLQGPDGSATRAVFPITR